MAKSSRGTFLVGEKELMKRLNGLGKQSTVNRMARPALREASGEIRKAAKRLAPKKSGQLKKSIKNKVVTSKKTGTVFAVVGPAYGFKTVDENGRANDPAKYGHLVEFGTKPHVITAKNKKTLKYVNKTGNTVFPVSVMHPGTAPKPFLRPAYDSVNSKAIIAKRLGKELDKEAAKKR